MCVMLNIYVSLSELDQTQQVRRWTLARGEIKLWSCLPQLWSAMPSTAGDWRIGQTEQAIR